MTSQEYINTVIERAKMLIPLMKPRLGDSVDGYFDFFKKFMLNMAEWQDKHPSDETIMLILNCIGYEEKSWVEFVRKELEKRNDD